MKTLTLNIAGKKVEITVNVTEVINYNDEYGFEKGDEEYNENWVGVNASYSINDTDGFGQVQYDSFNKCWSADVDGNTLYDEIKKDLFSNFSEADLFDETNDYRIESDLHCDLMNDHLPKIIDFICDYAGSKA